MVGMHPATSSDVVLHHELIDRTRRGKISTVIAQSIVREIASDHLGPGSPLATEQAMAAQYGVGRASVREALRLLELQGIVEIRRGNGGGPVVGSSAAQRFGETMTMHMQVRGARMRDLNESMVHFEALHAARAAELVRDGHADMAAVADMVEESRRGLERDANCQLSSAQYVESGGQFHRFVHQISPNPVIDLLSDAVGHIYMTRTARGGASRFSRDTRQRLNVDHLRIADAIQAGDTTTARDLTHEHMLRASEAIFEVFPDLPDELVDWN
jgi:GntR family transcriptional regulator, transcriptional repressor for pyruvate dehydrogenase complex